MTDFEETVENMGGHRYTKKGTLLVIEKQWRD
jgi:hypothetical protein